MVTMFQFTPACEAGGVDLPHVVPEDLFQFTPACEAGALNVDGSQVAQSFNSLPRVKRELAMMIADEFKKVSIHSRV